MDILVIGGTGTVGSRVVDGLVDRGVEPRVMTRSPDSARAQKVGAEMPDWVVEDFRLNYEFFQEKGLRASKEELDHQKEVLGREPRSFDAFVEELTATWSVPGASPEASS